MSVTRKLMAGFLATCVSVSSVFAVSPRTFADSSNSENYDERTFDGLHLMSDVVDYGMFVASNTTEVNEELEKALAKKFSRKDLMDVTYEDLSKVTMLDLSGLKLQDVPTCINYMTNLSRLDLSSNLLQSEALKKLSLLGCTKLSNIDLSDNYLTSMPSWFVSDRVTRGNITKNFVDSASPRGIKTLQPTYYLMNGESVEVDNLKVQILKSIRLNDGKLIPEEFLDYDNIIPDDDSCVITIDNDVNWNFVVDGVVVAPTNSTVTVTIRMFNFPSNANTKTTVTLYLLNGSDLVSLSTRLGGLIDDCGALSKDDYTESSWTSFTRALDTAKAIVEYDKADVQMLTNALEGLSDAKNNLHYGTKAMQNTLKSLIKVGSGYKKDEFTPASWNTFSEALSEITEISSDKNARLEDAQRAVKRFQNAQAGLRTAELLVPKKILKSQFEGIYGENKTITASGVTIEGTNYKWYFNGKDLTKIVDFTPEVKDTDSSATNILMEAGSATGYRMFATTGKDVLPGKAILELDVSGTFYNGSYYLYKWDSGAKRSTMVGTAQVKDGIASIPLTENGVYYLSPRIQNFNLKSSKYKVDDSAKTITVNPSTTSVAAFKNNFEFGKYTTVLDADGKEAASTGFIKNGMTINAPNMDNYEIIHIGDVNNDGYFDTDDLYETFRTMLYGDLGERDLIIFDVDNSGSIDTDDISLMFKMMLSI